MWAPSPREKRSNWPSTGHGRCGSDLSDHTVLLRLTHAALTEHFCQVAAVAPDLLMYLYNLPARAGNHVSRACADAVIARCPNVIGIKDSSGDMATLSSFMGLGNGKFQVACGSDALLSRGLQAGAIAKVSGNANVFSEVLVDLFEAFWRGDLAAAARQQEILDPIRITLQGPGISRSTSTSWRRGQHCGACGRPCRGPAGRRQPQSRIRPRRGC